MTHDFDEVGKDERFVTIEELIAANGGGADIAPRAFRLRRPGKHRAPIFRRRRRAQVEDSFV